MSSLADRKRLISPEVIREALKLPDNFVCRDERVGVTWALGPMLTTRDSGFAAEANAEALQTYLKEHPEVDDQWYVLGANHWGFGWVEQIAFQVFEENPEIDDVRKQIEVLKETHRMREEAKVSDCCYLDPLRDLEQKLEVLQGPSEVFELLLDWKKRLEEDPVADHELYEEKRKEAALETIRWAHGIHVRSEAPETWVEEVFEQLDEACKISEEPSGGIFIDWVDINAALEQLGYYGD